MRKEIALYISKSVYWLQKMGFKESKYADDLIFENDFIQISFTFIKGKFGKSFLTSIKKKDENKNYFLNELLQFLDQQEIEYRPGEKDEIFIKRNLDALEAIVQSELLNVVQGREWIDVPRDYMGYR